MIEIIKKTETFVYEHHKSDSSGHDWYHIDRVRNLAKKIATMEEKGDLFVIEMAALLHDISDPKLNSSKDAGKKKLLNFLDTINIDVHVKDCILEIIESISFKGGHERKLATIEAKIVRDADRLDAIGAIGIARAFAFAGHKGNPIYDPKYEVRKNMSEEEYRTNQTSAIHHFYEKLLKLKDLMLTESGKQLAEGRHKFLEQFLNQFYKEWNGEQ